MFLAFCFDFSPIFFSPSPPFSPYLLRTCAPSQEFGESLGRKKKKKEEEKTQFSKFLKVPRR